MSNANDSATAQSWLYEGIWGMLSGFFCVPRTSPILPAIDRESVVSRKPSPGFLRYLKFQFWVSIAIITIIVMVASIVILIASEEPLVLIGSVAVVILFAAISLIGYLAIYLRFDTTWYVFSDRSMRLRRGIWLIRESTITFENVQNVKVTQGPLQRFFGIANVVVETAGGGGAVNEAGAGLGMHAGLIEGVAEAAEIRDSIMSRVKTTKTTGLGDEETGTTHPASCWSPRHVETLREIRDLAKQLAHR